MDIVTLNDLSIAIGIMLGIDMEEARNYANTVMDLFGFDDRIVDNMLEQRERQLFYLLEAVGLLKTGREDITLHDGRNWRVHYWILNKVVILQYSDSSNVKRLISRSDRDKKYRKFQQDTIYSNLPSDIWLKRKNPYI